jgi:hypothetical protein
MDKRQLLYLMIDKLLEIEDSSLKGVNFSYSTNIGLCFHITSRPGAGHEWLTESKHVYTPLEKYPGQLEKALAEIQRIINLPDAEPFVNLKISATKAKELGLIA